MRFDRFDICEAYWVFATLWHASGQCMHPESGREIFSRLERLKFQPRPSLSEDTLEENAREILDALERQERGGGRTPTPAWVQHVRDHFARQDGDV
jgi:hypothetical protein